MRRSVAGVTVVSLAAGLLLVACGPDRPDPTGPTTAPLADASAGEQNPLAPRVNLDVPLRGGPDTRDRRGHIAFRQPEDADLIAFLNTQVQGLAPNTSYRLQRAVDAVVDDNCTSQTWLTLGKGTVPRAITTDYRGRGQEQLFRQLATAGATFDIHFRVIDAVTSAVVLQSDCYQFVVSR